MPGVHTAVDPARHTRQREHRAGRGTRRRRRRRGGLGGCQLGWPSRPASLRCARHVARDRALPGARGLGRRWTAARARPDVQSRRARGGGLGEGSDLADGRPGRGGGWLQRWAEGDGPRDRTARCRGHHPQLRGALLGNRARRVGARDGYRRRRAAGRAHGFLTPLPRWLTRRVGGTGRLGGGDPRRRVARRAGEQLDGRRVGHGWGGRRSQAPPCPLAYRTYRGLRVGFHRARLRTAGRLPG